MNMERHIASCHPTIFEEIVSRKEEIKKRKAEENLKCNVARKNEKHNFLRIEMNF